jgi:uncharacterized protein YggL (DUF469 family)
MSQPFGLATGTDVSDVLSRQENIMKKRLRKKKRLGEFREYAILAVLVYPLNEGEVLDQACDRLLDWADERGISCCGGFEVVNDFALADFVLSRYKGSATLEDVESLRCWALEHQAIYTSFHGSVDVWHGQWGDSELEKERHAEAKAAARRGK